MSRWQETIQNIPANSALMNSLMKLGNNYSFQNCALSLNTSIKDTLFKLPWACPVVWAWYIDHITTCLFVTKASRQHESSRCKWLDSAGKE